jgi:hypothetical protein
MNLGFQILVDKLQEDFGLSNWVIELEEVKGLKQNAKTVADPRYNRAKISVSPVVLENKNEWERVVIHELIHIIMAMYDFYVDNKIKDQDVISVERESAVSQLGEILIRYAKSN